MLDPNEEAKFAKLKAMCRELKVPAPPEIMIRFQVHDKDGVLTFDDIQRGHSWTRNFYNALFAFASTSPGDNTAAFEAGKMSSKNIVPSIFSSNVYGIGVADGNTYNTSGIAVGGTIGFMNGLANADFGIVVGTGSTAFSAENYDLATKVAHGNSATQLYYQGMLKPVPSYNGGTKTWTCSLSRIFNNNSGGSIIVAETGLISCAGLFTRTNQTNSLFLLERSLADPTVEVENGAQLTVGYGVSLDFSAID